jgi:hypothetical protein
MIRTIFFVSVLAFVFGYKNKSPGTPVTFVNVADTIPMPVFPVKDSLGLPDGYKANIVTPVCESDKCYIIEIDFYWDLIGRFVRYDTIPGMGLTKLDHVPLTEEDYLKLQEILSNRNSILSTYTKDELINSTRTSEIDGITGATAAEIKENVISGGSIHVLRYGILRTDLLKIVCRKNTASAFSEGLIKKLVSHKDQEINYFLINNLSEENFMKYLDEVLQTIHQAEGYYVKNVIEKMPEIVVADSLAQQFFAINFSRFNYYAQVALLQKLNAKSLSLDMITTLGENMDDRNSYKNELIKSLLASENDP